jgi:cyclic pyranopterin phosphate synthase
MAKSAKSSAASRRANPLSHVDADGNVQMVDVSQKAPTRRSAVATASVRMLPATLDIIREGKSTKGDVLQVARLAGIQAAKQTALLIPLCHAIPLTLVELDFAFSGNDRLHISAKTKAEHQTGVEMEALTAAAVAALTVYDMCKAVDRGMVIEAIQLQEKLGGKSGDFRRS